MITRVDDCFFCKEGDNFQCLITSYRHKVTCYCLIQGNKAAENEEPANQFFEKIDKNSGNKNLTITSFMNTCKNSVNSTHYALTCDVHDNDIKLTHCTCMGFNDQEPYNATQNIYNTTKLWRYSKGRNRQLTSNVNYNGDSRKGYCKNQDMRDINKGAELEIFDLNGFASGDDMMTKETIIFPNTGGEEELEFSGMDMIEPTNQLPIIMKSSVDDRTTPNDILTVNSILESKKKYYTTNSYPLTTPYPTKLFFSTITETPTIHQTNNPLIENLTSEKNTVIPRKTTTDILLVVKDDKKIEEHLTNTLIEYATTQITTSKAEKLHSITANTKKMTSTEPNLLISTYLPDQIVSSIENAVTHTTNQYDISVTSYTKSINELVEKTTQKDDLYVQTMQTTIITPMKTERQDDQISTTSFTQLTTKNIQKTLPTKKQTYESFSTSEPSILSTKYSTVVDYATTNPPTNDQMNTEIIDMTVNHRTTLKIDNLTFKDQNTTPSTHNISTESTIAFDQTTITDKVNIDQSPVSESFIDSKSLTIVIGLSLVYTCIFLLLFFAFYFLIKKCIRRRTQSVREQEYI